MSSTTISPIVPVDEPSTVAAAEGGTDTVPTFDKLPFESPEFGVEGFLPHLGAPTDG